MTCVVGSDARADDQLRVFVVGDLGIFNQKFVKDLLSPLLPLRVGALRLVGGDLGRSLVTAATCRQKTRSPAAG